MKQILIVDDDRSALDVVMRALAGYRLHFARDPDEALAIAGKLVALDLLVTDYMMPSMMGDELIARLRDIWPTLNVLIVTGHSEILDAENLPWWTAEAHLAKPFALGALRQAVADLIGAP
jgi:CheY-like chemotaxis protein